MKDKHSGAEWLENSYKKELSDLGRKVGDILGQVFLGIYHIQREVLHERVKWDNKYIIEIVVGSHWFATVDSNALTALVVQCHDACVRCEIKGASSWGYLRLSFHQRTRGDSNMECHPTMDQALEKMKPLRIFRED